KQEIHLGQAETERTDAGDHVEVGELRRVIGDTAWHTGQTQEVHREEGDVERDQRRPEMELAAPFVVHVTGPLRAPVVETGEQREQRTGHQYVVEVRDHVVSVVQLDVDRGY